MEEINPKRRMHFCPHFGHQMFKKKYAEIFGFIKYEMKTGY